MAHRCVLLAAGLLALAILAAGCSGGVGESKVTQANLEKIKPGMTLAETEAIMGKGEKVGSASLSVGSAAATTTATSSATSPEASVSVEIYAWGNKAFIDALKGNQSPAEVTGAKGITVNVMAGKVTAAVPVGL